MFKTVQETNQQILTHLGLVDGSAVQFYTEPQILQSINEAFQFLFDKRFWKFITHTTFHDLDGSAGVITDTVTSIDKIEDIQWIKLEPYKRYNILKYLPEDDPEEHGINSYAAKFWEDVDYKTKLFKVYPKDLTGRIAVRARRMPKVFVNGSTVIPFDNLAISYLATANLLAVDGTNPNAENRFNSLFAQRYEDLVVQENERILSYGSSGSDSFTVA